MWTRKDANVKSLFSFGVHNQNLEYDFSWIKIKQYLVIIFIYPENKSLWIKNMQLIKWKKCYFYLKSVIDYNIKC